MSPALTLAFLGSLQEWILTLVIGLLLFGRNLPDVARQLGRSLAVLRRHVDEFKAELSRDDGVKSARETITDARRGLTDLKRTTDPRRQLPNPKSVIDDLTTSTKDVIEGKPTEPSSGDPGDSSGTPAS